MTRAMGHGPNSGLPLVADNTAALVAQQAVDAGVDVPEPPCRVRRLRGGDVTAQP